MYGFTTPYFTCPQDALVKIAKKLKKNNVAVDLVSFGHEADNEEKLTAFHSAVNSNDNSHLVTVPPGPVLSDVLIGSPIFQVSLGFGYHNVRKHYGIGRFELW